MSKACENCHRLSPAPIRFKTFIPSNENIVFWKDLFMNLMLFKGNSVLPIKDSATLFFAATFMDTHGVKFGPAVEGIWLTFVTTWCLNCT